MLRKFLRTLLPSVFYFKDKEGKTIVANKRLSVVKETVKTLYSLNKYPDWDLHYIVEVNLLTGIWLKEYKPILDGVELRWIEVDADGDISFINVIVCVLINIIAAITFILGEFVFWFFALIDLIFIFAKLFATIISFPLYISFRLFFYFWMNTVRAKSVEKMKANGTYEKFMKAEWNRAFTHTRIVTVLLLLLYLWLKFYNT